MAEKYVADEGNEPHKAGLFDIRVIIGALIGLYGLIIVIASFFTSQADIDKAGGLNINLTAGIGMLVVSAAFVAWARWRPIVVADDAGREDVARPPAH